MATGALGERHRRLTGLLAAVALYRARESCRNTLGMAFRQRP
jgi:hypothetical protein